MTQQTAGELFILALLTIVCARIFFLRKVKADVIATVPVLALILSVLNILAWGLSITEVAIFLLSLFVTIWNIRAMLRLASKLVIDHYSGLFIFISAVNLIITLALAVAIILFSPTHASLKKFSVTRTDSVYSGSFSEGFAERENPFANAGAKVSVFEGENATNKKVLFVPSKCASTDSYQPMLVKLAHDGYTVYAAEFYADDLLWFEGGWKNLSMTRRTMFIHTRLYGNDQSVFLRTEDFAKEYVALLEIAHPSAEDFVILLADDDRAYAMNYCARSFPSLVDRVFDIATISDYETRGFGPVEQTAPLFARMKFDKEKDPTLFMSSHLATVFELSVK